MIDLKNLDWLTSEQASAVRKVQHDRDKYGLVLMMIAAGCADPQAIAKETLRAAGIQMDDKA